MNIRELVSDLMSVPGLSGHEDRVRRQIAKHLSPFLSSLHQDVRSQIFYEENSISQPAKTSASHYLWSVVASGEGRPLEGDVQVRFS